MRTQDEIIARCREVIHRARRKFLKKNLRPCPINCEFATKHGSEIDGCRQCGSYNVERCMRPEEFVPLSTKDELVAQFRDELYDKQILFRKYPAIGVMLWTLGIVETSEDGPVNEPEQLEELERHANSGN